MHCLRTTRVPKDPHGGEAWWVATSIPLLPPSTLLQLHAHLPIRNRCILRHALHTALFIRRALIPEYMALLTLLPIQRAIRHVGGGLAHTLHHDRTTNH